MKLFLNIIFSIPGIIGCEWCQVDVDGDTPLIAPFCTHQLSCFNGILGSLTPYGEGDLGESANNAVSLQSALKFFFYSLIAAIAIDSMLPSTYATIGPVIGAVLILCAVIALAMYCYRHNIEPGKAQSKWQIIHQTLNCSFVIVKSQALSNCTSSQYQPNITSVCRWPGSITTA